MALDRISWHPSFASAVQLELGSYGGRLVYDTEHELNRQPLRIDLLVVKKDPGLEIENEIASAFRGHNILEFKSEQDSLTIDDLYKVLAYGCLYKAYGTGVNAIRADDVTVMLIRHGKPTGMLSDVESLGYQVAHKAPGMYDIDGLLFPVRVVVSSELDCGQHIWLTSLSSNLETMQVRNLLSAMATLDDEGRRRLAEPILNVVTLANTDVIERLKEEDEMGKTIYEVMKPEIDEAIAKARMEAVAEGTAFGMEKGMEKGMAMAIRDTVRRLLQRGGYSDKEIAEIAGTDEAEVRAIAASMDVIPA